MSTATTLPSYETKFNKITEAYIKGEIEPYSASLCFCGTLADHDLDWDIKTINGYNPKQFVKMEYALLSTILTETLGGNPENKIHLYGLGEGVCRTEILRHPNYEAALFNGMVAALEVLKQIHIEHDEVIDEQKTKSQKRTLQTVKIRTHDSSRKSKRTCR